MCEPEKLTHLAVLDKGFVKLDGLFGNELTIVNSARVSYGVTTEELSEKDKKLLNYLWKNSHWSPFRHVLFRFRIRAPEFVMRQLYKHIVGIECSSGMATKDSAWNEISGRYTKIENFHVPSTWRSQHTSSKQCSGEDLEGSTNEKAKEIYEKTLSLARDSYNELLSLGVAREQARIVLPLCQYTEVVWTCSLQALHNFISLRDHFHAQHEIREYALAMKKFLQIYLPALYDIWFPTHEVANGE